MQITFIMTIINLIILIAFISAVVYLFMLIVRALKKYINSQDVRKEKSETRKSLGEVLKKYRTDNKMTQEFVAESLGVSRQAAVDFKHDRAGKALRGDSGRTPKEYMKFRFLVPSQE